MISNGGIAMERFYLGKRFYGIARRDDSASGPAFKTREWFANLRLHLAAGQYLCKLSWHVAFSFRKATSEWNLGMSN